MYSSGKISIKLITAIASFAGAFTLLYKSMFQDLFHAWMNEEDYSHGFLIMPISLYLIWRSRDELLRVTKQPNNWGIAVLSLWAALYFLGYVGDISTFVSYSMIIVIFGTVITIHGYQMAKKISFPILFLIFMIPIPSEIYTTLTNPLMLMATTSSVGFLDLFNIPVYREGNLIHLPNYSMKVVVACSGMRSLVSITALALLMGYVIFKSNIRRAVLWMLSIPVAFLGNILRITVTGMIAFFISTELAEGYSHTMAGLVTFAFSILILLTVIWIMQWITPEKD